MENTWASGASELLRHADSHINLDTAFDRRIAFISIDNAVETMIRVFLSLPKSKSGISIHRKQLEEAEKSFPLLLEMFWNNVAHASPVSISRISSIIIGSETLSIITELG
jgi:hypothetical protein